MREPLIARTYYNCRNEHPLQNMSIRISSDLANSLPAGLSKKNHMKYPINVLLF